MKYKKSDFPSVNNVDIRKFKISTNQNDVTLDYYDGCDEQIFVPYGVTVIGERAFRNKEYCYGEQVSEYGSEYLEEVIIPNTVNAVCGEAFLDCEDLKRIYIPESVSFISADAFDGCKSLEEIEIDGNNQFYKVDEGFIIDILDNVHICGIAGSKILTFDIEKRMIENAFNMRTLESIEIPEGVTKIEDYAFTGCTNLKEVKLPKTLKSIGVCAFSQCRSLTRIILPENLKRIESTAFGFSGLKEIALPEGLEYVGQNAFWHSGLQSIKLSPDCKYEHALFENCSSLTRVEFLDGWKKIPTAFFKKSGVEELILPDSVEEIGISAFAFCYGLKKITLPSNLKKICEQAFYCSGLEEIDFPENLETVEYSAFGYCSELKHITVPPKVVENASDVFCCCSQLESVVIEEGTKIVAHNSFSSCRKLHSVTLPDSLEKIGGHAFGECTKLKEIVVPKHVKIAGDAFYECGVEPIDELDLMDMSMREYKKRMRVKSNIKITRR